MFVKAKLLLALLFCLIRLPVSMAEEVDYVFKWILPPEYNFCHHFSEGRAWVQKDDDGPWTLIDNNGNVLKDNFEASWGVGKYNEGLTYFSRRDRLSGTFENGFLDISGNIVTSLKNIKEEDIYEDLLRFCGSSMSFKKEDNGLSGYINIFTRDWVIQPSYEDPGIFKEGMVRVCKDGKYGYIDKKGNNITEFIFDEAFDFNNGMAVVKSGDKYGLINKEGTIVAEPIYEGYYRPWSNLIGFRKNGKVGFLDVTGRTVIDFKFTPHPRDLEVLKNVRGKDYFYTHCYAFNDGRAVIFDEDTEKYWVIDEKGERLFNIRLGHNWPLMFRGGFLLSQYRGETIAYDVNGKQFDISSYLPSYYEIFPYNDNPFTVRNKENNKMGYFTLKLMKEEIKNGK